MAKKPEEPNLLQQLKEEIRQGEPGRLYFFYGEETFLLHHYLKQLRKIIVDPLTESFNFHKLTAETFDMRTFADCVENLPMMAERTMVIVDEIDIFKLNEADRERMMELLSDIPEYCTVVFTYETTPFKPDKRLKKLWDAVFQNGTLVEFQKQSQRDLVSWISRHFAASGKRIAPDLCVYLMDITGGTMTALSSEISKICAYSGADEIRKSDIDAVVEPVLDAVVFQMTDLMGNGEYGPALLKLQQLLKMQEEPIGILAVIGNHFRRLSTAKTLLDSGKTAVDLMKLYGMGDYPARKAMSAAGRFSTRFYKRAAELVLESDVQLKTSYDDAERILEVLILQLAREARND
ncbi:MAG: DNA polymerase III subunit delta [Oscillospiraceae bacterium]|nr:DNA polymerase III subunit delta [Oscillospiraceae bacterium]